MYQHVHIQVSCIHELWTVSTMTKTGLTFSQSNLRLSIAVPALEFSTSDLVKWIRNREKSRQFCENFTNFKTSTMEKRATNTPNGFVMFVWKWATIDYPIPSTVSSSFSHIFPILTLKLREFLVPDTQSLLRNVTTWSRFVPVQISSETKVLTLRMNPGISWGAGISPPHRSDRIIMW